MDDLSYSRLGGLCSGSATGFNGLRRSAVALTASTRVASRQNANAMQTARLQAVRRRKFYQARKGKGGLARVSGVFVPVLTLDWTGTKEGRQTRKRGQGSVAWASAAIAVRYRCTGVAYRVCLAGLPSGLACSPQMQTRNTLSYRPGGAPQGPREGWAGPAEASSKRHGLPLH